MKYGKDMAMCWLVQIKAIFLSLDIDSKLEIVPI